MLYKTFNADIDLRPRTQLLQGDGLIGILTHLSGHHSDAPRLRQGDDAEEANEISLRPPSSGTGFATTVPTPLTPCMLRWSLHCTC